MMSKVLATIFLFWLALPAAAEDWRRVDLGALLFDVPEPWQFFHDPVSGSGGYAAVQDASGPSGIGVAVLPGDLTATLPATDILSVTPIDLNGTAASEIVLVEPMQPGSQARYIDIDTPDGPVVLMLVVPEAEAVAMAEVFDQIIASVQLNPEPSDTVADPSGEWYLDGDAAKLLTLTRQNPGIAFDLSGEDVQLIVTRRDPRTFQIVLDDWVTIGVLSQDNQQINWDDGMVWARSIGVVEGAPMGLVGVSVPMALGPIEIWVPALWQTSQQTDALGRPFVVATDAEGEAVARLVILPGTGDAAMFNALVAEALGDAGGAPVEPETPWVYAHDASGQMDLASGTRAAQVRLRAIPVPGGMAVLLVIWAEDGLYLTQEDASQIVYGATLVQPADAAVAETAALPEGVLFAGEMTADWQPVASAGGDFDRFAQVAGGALQVDVPGGAGWGKAGIWSTRPLVTFDGPRDTVALQLRLKPDRTTNFVLSLDPRAEVEEWSVHDLRLHWTTVADGSTSHAALFVRQQQVAAVDLPGPVPDVLELRLDPAGTARLLLPDGQSLEAQLPLPLPVEGFFLHIVTHSAEAEGPARLVLTEVSLTHGAPAAASISPYPQPAAPQVLFDSTRGRIWAPLMLAGGDFARDARIDGAGLTVSVAPDLGWATAGLYTPTPAIWLDDFHSDAAVTLDWSIDPANSDGFVLAMARPGAGNYPGEPPAPALIFVFQTDPVTGQGHALLRLNNDVPGDAWSSDGPVTAPSRVQMILRPGEVTIEAEGFAPVTLPWSQAVEGAGLHLYAYGIAQTVDVAHRWALKGVAVTRTASTVPRPAAGPAKGVSPLPMTQVFDGTPGPNWEPAAAWGGNFDAFARMDGGKLSVNVPAGNSWGMTGLLSSEPVLHLDQRNLLTPARIDLALDPMADPAFNLSLSRSKTPDMWPDHVVWFSLARVPGRDVWAMTLHCSPYQVWTREIDAAWMDTQWDGRVQIDVGIGWASIALPDGPILRGEVPSMPNDALYATVMTHAAGENLPARLDVLDLHTGMVTPPGLTAIDRWALVDSADFVPDDFLNDIAAELEILP